MAAEGASEMDGRCRETAISVRATKEGANRPLSARVSSGFLQSDPVNRAEVAWVACGAVWRRDPPSRS